MKILKIFLGVLTAVGGFVDIGDLVASSEAGARFRLALAWAIVLGVIGIVLFAEMAGRVAAVSGRPVFDLVRERLGPRAALLNLVGSVGVTFLTLTAEVAGVAIAFELITSVNYLLWLPVCGVLLWLVIWRVKFDMIENVFGIGGLALIAFSIAVWKFGPDWSSVLHEMTHPSVPSGEGTPTYFYWAIALFGSAMTPYEVFFFSSGAVEERWSKADLALERVNVYLGFPLGGVLSLSIMALAAFVLQPLNIDVSSLSQVSAPVALELGKLGLGFALLGFLAAVSGAAIETALSTGYTVAQFFGWSWGKLVKPARAPLFHTVVIVAVLAAVAIGLTTIDPVKITEYSIVLSAVALPLTYFPILVIANDPEYLGDKTNRWFMNLLGSVFFVITTVAALAAIPLMIATKAGSS